MENPLGCEKQCLIQLCITTPTQPPCQVNGGQFIPEILTFSRRETQFTNCFSQCLSHFVFEVVSFSNTHTNFCFLFEIPKTGFHLNTHNMLTVLVSGIYCDPAHVVETESDVWSPITCHFSCPVWWSSSTVSSHTNTPAYTHTHTPPPPLPDTTACVIKVNCLDLSISFKLGQVFILLFSVVQPELGINRVDSL